MKPVTRVLGLVVLAVTSRGLYAQSAQLSAGQSPAAALCSVLRENYTNFQQCHSATQAQMCAMAQLENTDPTQARRFDAIMGETSPDKTIRLVADFVRKYPESTLLSYAYFFEANAYQQKGDVEKIVKYSDRSLSSDPNNLVSLILSVRALSMPQYIKSHRTEGGKILRQAQVEAAHALALVLEIPRQPRESEVDYHKRLAAVSSEVHGALGTVHLELASGGPRGLNKAELARAEQEFKIAVANSRQPDPRDYYRLGEAYGAEGKWDDAIQAYAKAGKIGQDTLISEYASEQIGHLKRKKAQSLAAANPTSAPGN